MATLVLRIRGQGQDPSGAQTMTEKPKAFHFGGGPCAWLQVVAFKACLGKACVIGWLVLSEAISSVGRKYQICLPFSRKLDVVLNNLTSVGLQMHQKC